MLCAPVRLEGTRDGVFLPPSVLPPTFLTRFKDNGKEWWRSLGHKATKGNEENKAIFAARSPDEFVICTLRCRLRGTECNNTASRRHVPLQGGVQSLMLAAGWGTKPHIGLWGEVQSLMLGCRAGYRASHKAAG